MTEHEALIEDYLNGELSPADFPTLRAFLSEEQNMRAFVCLAHQHGVMLLELSESKSALHGRNHVVESQSIDKGGWDTSVLKAMRLASKLLSGLLSNPEASVAEVVATACKLSRHQPGARLRPRHNARQSTLASSGECFCRWRSRFCSRLQLAATMSSVLQHKKCVTVG